MCLSVVTTMALAVGDMTYGSTLLVPMNQRVLNNFQLVQLNH